MTEPSAKPGTGVAAQVAGLEKVAPPLATADPVIDRAHLQRMTHGERALEREVLELFAAQAGILLARMRDAAPAAAAALAHTLNGSARGIGAWPVAEAAAAVEGAAADGRDTAPAVAQLAVAVRAAQVAISDLSHA